MYVLQECYESREHLFFECGCSKRLWRELMSRCLVLDTSIEWPAVMCMGLNEWRDKILKAIICRIAWSDVDQLWRQRNDIR